MVVETIVVVSGEAASGIEIVGNVVVSTFSELAEAPYPKNIGNRKIEPFEGKSLVPIFDGKVREQH